MSDQLYKKVKGRYVKVGPEDWDTFRENYWSPGLWLVTNKPGERSRSCLHRLCEVPTNPTLYAGILDLTNQLCKLLYELEQPVATDKTGLIKHYRSRFETAHAILEWLAKEHGIKMVPFTEPTAGDRKIEMEL